MITKFNEYIKESLRDKMTGVLSKEQIDEVIYEDDLDQAMLGITDGGICGVYFSKFVEDPNEHWFNASIDERKKILNDYLDLEISYKTIDDE